MVERALFGGALRCDLPSTFLVCEASCSYTHTRDCAAGIPGVSCGLPGIYSP